MNNDQPPATTAATAAPAAQQPIYHAAAMSHGHPGGFPWPQHQPNYFAAPGSHTGMPAHGYWSPPNSWFGPGPSMPQNATPKGRECKAAPVKRRGPGRPPKRVKVDEDEDYTPPRSFQEQESESSASALKLPSRCPEDVAIPIQKEDSCCYCQYWLGRYIIKPCYHFGFCINCIEKIHRTEAIPKCVACHTPIEEYLAAFKSHIGDIAPIV